MSKETIEKDNADLYLLLPYPRPVLNVICRNAVNETWQKDWETSENGRDTFLIFNKVNADFVSSKEWLLIFFRDMAVSQLI